MSFVQPMIFCTTLLQKPLRQRGTVPKLSDSEVITMELVGEWCGLYRDTAIQKYRHVDSTAPQCEYPELKTAIGITSHMVRKMRALTVGVYFNLQAGKEPMQFEGLIAA